MTERDALCDKGISGPGSQIKDHLQICHGGYQEISVDSLSLESKFGQSALLNRNTFPGFCFWVCIDHIVVSKVRPTTNLVHKGGICVQEQVKGAFESSVFGYHL